MSIWNALNSAYSFEDAFGAKDCTSQAMREAVREWFRLYYHREATEESDPCQQIAYTIVHKLTKTSFGEYKAVSNDEFAQQVLDALGTVRKKAMQLALVGGESWLKPVPTGDSFSFSVVSRNNVLIFGRDAQGVPMDIGAVEQTAEGRQWYTLLERRTVDRSGKLTIRNRLYCSELSDTLGRPVPLSALARYELLPEEYTFQEPLGGLGMARLITPLENCVDGSQDGVSVYAPAVGLIRNIDHNEALLNGEFDRGQSRIIASADLFRRGRDGRRQLSDKLFVGIDDNPEAVGLTIFSPELREQSFLARKQEYLRSAENIIGLKRGLLSEVEAAFTEHWLLCSCGGVTAFVYPYFHLMFMTESPVELVSPSRLDERTERERQELLEAIASGAEGNGMTGGQQPGAASAGDRGSAEEQGTPLAAGPIGDRELSQDTGKKDVLITEVLSYGAFLPGTAQPSFDTVSGTRDTGWREWFSDFAAGRSPVGAAAVQTGPFVYEFSAVRSVKLPRQEYYLAAQSGVETATVLRKWKDGTLWYQSAVRREDGA